ncbi:ArsR/SmtB family transcription factor [Roseibacillus persicicus]|uniref:Transcriptional regulator n=2 Tax=Roseibacillus persicicus TaxID=454148 RepID=A0A918TIR0_9BACT|nr:metalloregulator ArsR/SmtB family transcription factor [Roseibacillus persicicus]GHC46765.1 transcriptional regulator [Roseibacillus persicicus]
MSAKKKAGGQITPEGLEKLASVFRVFSEAGRLALLQELKNREMTVGELVDSAGIGQAGVSKHLKMMFDAGILSRRKDGTKVYYAVSDPMVYELCDLVCGKLVREQEAMKAIEYVI